MKHSVLARVGIIAVVAGPLSIGAAQSPPVSSSTPIAAQTQSVDEAPADANLYVYRDFVTPLVMKVIVKVDGEKVVSLSNHSFTAVRIAIGKHKIALAWPALSVQEGSNIDVDITEGHAVYLKVTSTRPNLFAGSITSLGPKKLIADDADAARAEIIRCCHYKEPTP